ncbi:hypothetical protein JGF61_23160 [Salmonella enterica subsp. enterica serovar Agona]|nr:hypothetical protein [Salmonella enterica subsp. enterica serovar Agona]
MGHSISEVVQALGFPRATVSRVCREYIDSGKTIPARANCRGQERVHEGGHRRLARIVTADRRASVQEITRQFNACALKRVSSHTIQNHLLAIGYRSRRTAADRTSQGAKISMGAGTSPLDPRQVGKCCLD